MQCPNCGATAEDIQNMARARDERSDRYRRLKQWLEKNSGQIADDVGEIMHELDEQRSIVEQIREMVL